MCARNGWRLFHTNSRGIHVIDKNGLNTPQVVLLTPPGRAAIASIVIVGPGAHEAVAAHFRAANRRRLDEQPKDRPVFGHWGRDGGEVVVLWVRHPDEIEVHCHGGRAVVEWIRECVESAGGRRCTFEEWLKREEPSPLRAAASIALSKAVTLRPAGILLDQYHGWLERELREICRLLHRAAETSAEPRDELPSRAADRIDRLLTRAPLGLHLTEPWNVVIGGRPNVGKSSLINALIGYERAVVDPRAGTTRDVVTAVAALEGWPVLLADTAGMRRRAGELEAEGIERAARAIGEADLKVLVLDRSQPLGRDDRALISRWPGAMLVANKGDLPDRTGGTLPEGAVHVSAKTGEGIEGLATVLGRALVPDPPAPGTPVPFCAGQVDALRVARDVLLRGDVSGARDVLRSLYIRET